MPFLVCKSCSVGFQPRSAITNATEIKHVNLVGQIAQCDVESANISP